MTYSIENLIMTHGMFDFTLFPNDTEFPRHNLNLIHIMSIVNAQTHGLHDIVCMIFLLIL